jgi:hypothetical protein
MFHGGGSGGGQLLNPGFFPAVSHLSAVRRFSDDSHWAQRGELGFRPGMPSITLEESPGEKQQQQHHQQQYQQQQHEGDRPTLDFLGVNEGHRRTAADSSYPGPTTT